MILRVALTAMSSHKPSIKQLVLSDPTSYLKYRKPRPYKDKQGHVKYDDPRDGNANGKMTVALGMSALGFAAAAIRRVRVEKSIIHQMWKANTTVGFASLDTYMCVYLYTYVCVCVCVYIYICIYMYICMYVYGVCECVCECACYVCVCIHM